MIQKFGEFLNEAKKPAIYVVGDIVRVIPGKLGKVLDYGSDNAYNTRGGMIVKITKVLEKSNKWVYETSLEYGAYYAYSNKTRSNSEISRYSKTLWNEKDFTLENVDNFLNIVKSSKFKVKDDISVNAKTEVIPFNANENRRSLPQSITSNIYAICVEPTIESGKACYIISDINGWKAFNGIIEEKNIKETLELSEEAIKIIAKEIAEKLGVELENTEKYFGFKTKHLTTKPSDSFSVFSPEGTIYFKDGASRLAFMEGVKALIKKHCSPELIIASKHGNPRISSVNKTDKFYDSPYDVLEISKNHIVDTAKDMKIDIEAVLHKNRGVIHGKGFGI